MPKTKPLDQEIEKKSRARAPNIISVSRRTDIPAFYSDWFFNRLQEGFVQVKKSVNAKTAKKVSLAPEDVRCFVFWTKNPGPMLNRLDELNEYHYYFQFTLTPYLNGIEKFLQPKEKLLKTFIQLSEKVRRDKVIWRYDPILLKDGIDIEYHKTEFARLFKELQGHTQKCVISFIDTRYLSAESKRQLKLKKITKKDMLGIGKEFQAIIKGTGIKIETCAEKIDLTDFDIIPGRCIDGDLIGNITGENFTIAKDPSQRKACGCVKSIDIGTDETCIHGCSFCYATRNEVQARVNYHNHNEKSSLLIGNQAVKK